jgi:hypothetical protein
LHNRSLSSFLLNKTPNDNYHKVLPNLSHFRIFGREAYPLDLNNSASKFEARAKKLHYDWIFYKTNTKIFASRDVKFNEDSVINCSGCEIEIIEDKSLGERSINENVDEHEEENDMMIKLKLIKMKL